MVFYTWGSLVHVRPKWFGIYFGLLIMYEKKMSFHFVDSNSISSSFEDQSNFTFITTRHRLNLDRLQENL